MGFRLWSGNTQHCRSAGCPAEWDPVADLGASEEETIPLFASLYIRGTDPERIRADYRSLFPPSRDGKGPDPSSFETEILYHYTVNEEVQRQMNVLVAGQRGDEPADAVRRVLSREDLSGRLRQALGQ